MNAAQRQSSLQGGEGAGYGKKGVASEFQAKLVIGFLDHFGIQQAVLVGNSAGGALAMEIALRHPERVRALVLVDAAVYIRMGGPPWLQPVFRTPQMRRMGPWLVRNIHAWGDDFARSAWHDPVNITPEIWAGYFQPLQAHDSRNVKNPLSAAPMPAGEARISCLPFHRNQSSGQRFFA